MAKDVWRCGHPRDFEHSDIKPDGSLKQCRECRRAGQTRRRRTRGISERQPTPSTFPCGHDRATHGRPRGDRRYLMCNTCKRAAARALKDAAGELKGRIKRGNPDVFPCGHARTGKNTRAVGTCRTCGNESQAQRSKAWRAANPQEAKRQAAEIYQERKLARGDVDTLEWLKLIRRDPCSYCGGGGGTVDHIEPKVRGGLNHWSNYAPACRSCNSSKNDSPLLIYLLRGQSG